MQPTKVDIISNAYSKIRISGLTVTPTPEDLELALSRLEDMLAEWNDTRNITLGYNFEDNPDPNSASNIPRWSADGVGSCLALRLLADFGKEPTQALYQMASASMSSISSKAARDRMRQVPYPTRQPVGSGSRWIPRWFRFYGPDNTAPNAPSTTTMKLGDINNFSVSFETYLNVGEALSSFTIEATSGLLINSSSINGESIDYNITAQNAGNWESIVIVATTDSGRVDTRVANFIVENV